MDLFSIILMAIGLAMDCFAVSISKGLAVGNSKDDSQQRGRVLLMATLFGLFQGGMPLLGYWGGTLFASFFSRYAPWVALGLLSFLGGKMIVEAMHEQKKKPNADFSVKTLLTLSVATSIDALATGVVFIPVPEQLWRGVGIIALVSWLFALLGYVIGKTAGKRLHVNVGIVGGVILIAIGIKIFVESVCF